MFNQSLKPFYSLAILIVLVGLACGTGSGGDATPTNPPAATAVEVAQATDVPTALPTVEPTKEDSGPPTLEPPPAATATDIPPTESNEPPAFYIEEFDGDITNYSYFVQNGVDGGSDMIFTADGALTFNITTEFTYVYMTYDPFSYGDVRIGLSAENRGVNSQNISLVCRLSSDGWFEFNIGGDGLYDILVRDELNNNYFNIFNGGSTLIKIGRNTNEYVAECIGDTLTLYINGTLAKTVTIPNAYRFMDEGLVGFSVSSFSALPVLVNIEWFGIEQPQ